MEFVKNLRISIGKGQIFSEVFISCDLSAASGRIEFFEDYKNLLQFLQENRVIPIYEKVFGHLDNYHQFISTRSSLYKHFKNDSADVPLSYSRDCR